MQATDTATKFKIAILDDRKNIIGYWRKFSDGSVVLFDSQYAAKKAMAVWALDGRVIPVEPR